MSWEALNQSLKVNKNLIKIVHCIENSRIKFFKTIMIKYFTYTYTNEIHNIR